MGTDWGGRPSLFSSFCLSFSVSLSFFLSPSLSISVFRAVGYGLLLAAGVVVVCVGEENNMGERTEKSDKGISSSDRGREEDSYRDLRG